jgi:hypothetical protein
MSADTEPQRLTKKQVKEFTDEVGYWLKVARETPNKGLSLVAFGMAAGTKRTVAEIEQDGANASLRRTWKSMAKMSLQDDIDAISLEAAQAIQKLHHDHPARQTAAIQLAVGSAISIAIALYESRRNTANASWWKDFEEWPMTPWDAADCSTGMSAPTASAPALAAGRRALSTPTVARFRCAAMRSAAESYSTTTAASRFSKSGGNDD